MTANYHTWVNLRNKNLQDIQIQTQVQGTNRCVCKFPKSLKVLKKFEKFPQF